MISEHSTRSNRFASVVLLLKILRRQDAVFLFKINDFMLQSRYYDRTKESN